MHHFVLIALACLLFAVALPVTAQEVTPEPSGYGNITVNDGGSLTLVQDTPISPAPEPGLDQLLSDALDKASSDGEAVPVVDPKAAADLLIKAVAAIVLGAFGNAPITSVIVSVLKRFQPFASRTAPELVFGVATVLWVIAAIVGAAGYGVQFNSLLDALTTIIPAVLGLLVSFPGAAATHELMAKASVPVLGHKRTPGVVAALSVPLAGGLNGSSFREL
jgi:hypothetical protein